MRKGYRDIRIVKARDNYVKMVVDGWIVEVLKKKNNILVKAYRVNPSLAMTVWELFASKTQ